MSMFKYYPKNVVPTTQLHSPIKQVILFNKVKREIKARWGFGTNFTSVLIIN